MNVGGIGERPSILEFVGLTEKYIEINCNNNKKFYAENYSQVSAVINILETSLYFTVRGVELIVTLQSNKTFHYREMVPCKYLP